jgi:hypothetical protein
VVALEAWPEPRFRTGAVTLLRDTVAPLAAVEAAVKSALSDSKRDTRQAGRACHDAYLARFPARRRDFHARCALHSLPPPLRAHTTAPSYRLRRGTA